MYDEAIAWAASTLGSPICEWARLSGGLTSTMLALSDGSGRQSVLRLMTNEPWRRHGAALTRREQAAQDELASTSVPAPNSLGLDADAQRRGSPLT
ncbi:MAG TPA: hypothetical protein VLA89_14620 [Gemmatimonadales bacterium]|nr:hypothetical protein [Gemmatimonadales bacterium]